MYGAKGYLDSDLYGKNGEQFELVFAPIFNDAACMDMSSGKDIASFIQRMRSILPQFEKAAFMARLSARDGVAVSVEIIERLRVMMLSVQKNFLENPYFDFADRDLRDRLLFASSQMTQGICLLQIGEADASN